MSATIWKNPTFYVSTAPKRVFGQDDVKKRYFYLLFLTI
jgi:hypothetical protein